MNHLRRLHCLLTNKDIDKRLEEREEWDVKQKKTERVKRKKKEERESVVKRQRQRSKEEKKKKSNEV